MWQRRSHLGDGKSGLEKSGYELLGGNSEHLTELSRFVYETANFNLRPGQLSVGQSRFCPQRWHARPCRQQGSLQLRTHFTRSGRQ